MRIGLSSKIIVTVVGVSLIAFLPLCYVGIRSVRADLEFVYMQKAETIARLLDAAIQRNGDLTDHAGLLIYIRKFMLLDPDVVGISVNLPRGDKLVTVVSDDVANVGREARDGHSTVYRQDRVSSDAAMTEDGRVMRLAAPIHLSKRQVGTFDVELTLEAVDERIAQAERVAIVAFLATFVIFSVLLSFLLRRIVVRPLDALHSGVERIAGGDLDASVDLDSSDEIGDLGRAFNRMGADLKVARARIEERSAALSKVVEERQALDERLRQAEKMDAIGRLAGGVAHDFNNHLMVIGGYSELLAKQVPDPTQERYAEMIRTSAAHATELTRQLLAFARKGHYRAAPTDLHEVVDKVVEMLKHSIDKRIEIHTHLDAVPSTVIGDASQLSNAVLNLGLNAKDAMPDGGRLVFGTALVDSDAASDTGAPFEIDDGTYISLTVTDTGVGIEGSDTERVFEPFYTTKILGEGTGLGLASVYGTIKAHGGYITVASEPAVGTRFTLLLPSAPEAATATASPEFPIVPHPRGHVLVVDDEEPVRQVVSEMLMNLGYSFVLAGAARDALERYRAERDAFNVVLLDLMMPDMSGADALNEIRLMNPKVPVILASGYAVQEVTQRLVHTDGVVLLQKPFTARTLEHALDDAIRFRKSA